MGGSLSEWEADSGQKDDRAVSGLVRPVYAPCGLFLGGGGESVPKRRFRGRVGLCGKTGSLAESGRFRLQMRGEHAGMPGREQGRKSSRRKDRGCKTSPARATASGSAGRGRDGAKESRLKKRGCQNVSVRKAGLQTREGADHKEGCMGLRLCGGNRGVQEAVPVPAERMVVHVPEPKEKRKFALWARPETLAKVKERYRADDCRSQSEFIEKAVLFYLGYLEAGEPGSYLPGMFLSTMKSITAESDNRMGRLLFKLAVELAVTMNVVAAGSEIDRVSLERLRGECVKEVKRLNGSFSFDDAMSWQKGWEGIA